MGINITQFAPPAKVSNLVWDQNMTAGVGKNFQGNLTGDVTGNVRGDVTGDVTGNVTGNVNGYTIKTDWSASAGLTDLLLATSPTSLQIYQLPPFNSMSGVMRLWCPVFSNPDGSSVFVVIDFLDTNMDLISRYSISDNVERDIVIPEGTNGIYMRANTHYNYVPTIHMRNLILS